MALTDISDLECVIAVIYGERCGNPVSHGKRRCADHSRWNLGLNLSKNQKAVLLWLTGHQSKPYLRVSSIRRACRGLYQRGLLELPEPPQKNIEDGSPTQWGCDVAGGLR